MFYPEIFREIADKAEADLYILPSSINEVILLKQEGGEDRMQVMEMKNMVKSVNRNEVAPEEVLTGSVYRYSRKNGEIEIAV